MAKEKQQSMPKEVRRLKNKSILLTWLDKHLKRLYGAVSHSVAARFLCGYDQISERVKASFFVSKAQSAVLALKKKLLRKPRRELGSESLGKDEVGIFVPSSLHKSLKTRLSEAVEESVCIRKAGAFLRRMLLVPMISYGVFLFAFGLFTTVIQAVAFFLKGQNTGAALDLFVGLVLVLLSLPMMFKGYESLIGCLKKSVSGHLILQSVFGVTGKISGPEMGQRVNLLLFLVGMLCGTATWLLPPMEMVACGLLLLLAIGVLFVPETGLVLLLTLFPFFNYFSHPSMVCGGVVLYVGGCWLIKAVLGKRSFSVDLIDAVALCFMILIFTTGFAGGTLSMQSALLYLSMMFGYLIAANLLRSRLWIRRCSSGLIAGSFIVAFIGLIQWMLDLSVCSVFNGMLVLNCYLLAVIPLILARLSAAVRWRERIRYLLVLTVQTFCLAAGGSRLAAMVWLIEVIVFCLLSSRKTVPALLILALMLPMAACGLPLFGGLLPEAEITFSEARRAVWKELALLVGRAPLSGLGMSETLFMQALPEGAAGAAEWGNTFMMLAVQVGLPGLLLFLLLALIWYMAGFSLIRQGTITKQEKKYILAGITVLTGMLFMGCFCYLWADYRLLMLFWTMTGLFQAIRKYALEHECKKKDVAAPPENMQWVDLDLYFDSTGKPVGREFRSEQSGTGGSVK